MPGLTSELTPGGSLESAKNITKPHIALSVVSDIGTKFPNIGLHDKPHASYYLPLFTVIMNSISGGSLHWQLKQRLQIQYFGGFVGAVEFKPATKEL